MDQVRRKTLIFAPPTPPVAPHVPAAPKGLPVVGANSFVETGQVRFGAKQYRIALNLVCPVPNGFSRGEWSIFTDQMRYQGAFRVVPGSREITVEGCLPHSLMSNGFAEIKIFRDLDSQAIGSRFKIDLERKKVYAA